MENHILEEVKKLLPFIKRVRCWRKGSFMSRDKWCLVLDMEDDESKFYYYTDENQYFETLEFLGKYNLVNYYKSN